MSTIYAKKISIYTESSSFNDLKKPWIMGICKINTTITKSKVFHITLKNCHENSS